MSIKTLSTREIYRNRWISLREDRIRHDSGTEGIYSVVTKPDFALVIPRLGDDFFLVEQYRYPVKGRYMEFPQGTWEENAAATPEMVAVRELQEETGLSAGKMTYLGPLFLAYGLMDQRMHTFLAEELTQGQASPAPEEGDLVCKRVPIREFEAGILNGTILDACSVAAYGLLKMRGL
jgi:8-oxo-dGTP pyrophosphatase MutT (NUDIX family)